MSMDEVVDKMFPELAEDHTRQHVIRTTRLTIDGDCRTHYNIDIDKEADVVPGFLPFVFSPDTVTYINISKIEQIEVKPEDAQDLAEAVADSIGEIVGVIKENK